VVLRLALAGISLGDGDAPRLRRRDRHLTGSVADHVSLPAAGRHAQRDRHQHGGRDFHGVPFLGYVGAGNPGPCITAWIGSVLRIRGYSGEALASIARRLRI